MVEREPHDEGDSEELAPTSCRAQGDGCSELVGDVTRILSRIEAGETQASEQLLPLVYDELRRLAAARMAQERPGQTLQATALVHEAYMRLVDENQTQHWDSKGHFFAAAARAMRRILVEMARRKAGPRAGGGRVRHELADDDRVSYPISDDLLDLDAALTKLAKMDSQAAELVQLRVFSAMTTDEVAQYLGISPRTVKRNWAFARAWLAREMHGDS